MGKSVNAGVCTKLSAIIIDLATFAIDSNLATVPHSRQINKKDGTEAAPGITYHWGDFGARSAVLGGTAARHRGYTVHA